MKKLQLNLKAPRGAVVLTDDHAAALQLGGDPQALKDAAGPDEEIRPVLSAHTNLVITRPDARGARYQIRLSPGGPFLGESCVLSFSGLPDPLAASYLFAIVVRLTGELGFRTENVVWSYPWDPPDPQDLWVPEQFWPILFARMRRILAVSYARASRVVVGDAALEASYEEILRKLEELPKIHPQVPCSAYLCWHRGVRESGVTHWVPVRLASRRLRWKTPAPIRYVLWPHPAGFGWGDYVDKVTV